YVVSVNILMDPAVNYLPVRVTTHYPDGSLQTASEISYQNVVPNQAWFLDRIEQNTYEQAENVRDPKAKSPQGRTYVMEVKSLAKVNQDLPASTFRVDLPKDTYVED